MRALLVMGFVAISIAVSAEASATLTCETLAAPTFGEVTLGDHRYQATAGGLRIAHTKGQDAAVLTACDGLPGTYIQAVAAGPGGLITLAVRGRGLWTMHPTTYAVARLTSDDRLRWPTALAWRDGELWVGTVQTGLWRITNPGPRATIRQPLWRFRHHRVSSLAIAPDGALLVGRDVGGLWRVGPNGKSKRLLKGSVQGIDIRGDQVIVDRGTTRCALAPRRRCLPIPSEQEDRPASGLQSDHFTALLVHPTKGVPSLWAGTFDHGVFVRDDTGAWRAPEATGVAPRFVNTLASQGDSLWVATATGAFRLNDGQWTRFGEMHGLPSDHVNAVHVGDDGTLWFATSRGLARWRDEGIDVWGARDGLPYRIVYSVATHGEQVLAGTSYGLGIFDGEAWTSFRMGSSGLSDDWVNAVAFTTSGVPLVGTYDAGVDVVGVNGPGPVPALGKLWVNPSGLIAVGELQGVFIATLGDGLWFSRAGQAPRPWIPKGALPSDDVTSVAVFEDELWVGTRGGIARHPLARRP